VILALDVEGDTVPQMTCDSLAACFPYSVCHSADGFVYMWSSQQTGAASLLSFIPCVAVGEEEIAWDKRDIVILVS
jgi:hypothetical protein